MTPTNDLIRFSHFHSGGKRSKVNSRSQQAVKMAKASIIHVDSWASNVIFQFCLHQTHCKKTEIDTSYLNTR